MTKHFWLLTTYAYNKTSCDENSVQWQGVLEGQVWLLTARVSKSYLTQLNHFRDEFHQPVNSTGNVFFPQYSKVNHY